MWGEIVRDTVKVEADDKHMNFEQDGRRYRTDDHVAEMPAHVADKLIKADIPGVRRHSKSWSMGIDLKSMRPST